MGGLTYLVFTACLMQVFAVKVKVHSEQDDSKLEEENVSHTEVYEHKKNEGTLLPFLKSRRNMDEKKPEPIPEYEDDKPTTLKPKSQHPNDMIFPLIYSQNHVNSMFKFGENWYTWSTDKKSDGTSVVNYYFCADEPKHCDEVGWEHAESGIPKCAFQIDSLLTEDRACINTFGVEPHVGAVCEGGDLMKVSDMIKTCGPRIRSLWRFQRMSRRPTNAAKPADVNSLICEDEEECFITIEYRVHHDRITFSLHEPTRGQTFKSILKRENAEAEEKMTPAPEPHVHKKMHKTEKIEKEEEPKKKFRVRNKNKNKAEGKGIAKERNDSGAYSRRVNKHKVKVREDISEDISE